jgi:hypothetical protein
MLSKQLKINIFIKKSLKLFNLIIIIIITKYDE